MEYMYVPVNVSKSVQFMFQIEDWSSYSTEAFLQSHLRHKDLEVC